MPFTKKTRYDSTLRSTSCSLLVAGNRCPSCKTYRKALLQRKNRQENLLHKDIDCTRSTFKHRDIPSPLLIKKLNQQKHQIESLQTQVAQLQRRLTRKIDKEGVKVNKTKDVELKGLMAACNSEVMKAYPNQIHFRGYSGHSK